MAKRITMTKALHITGPTAEDWKLIEIPNHDLETLQSLVGDADEPGVTFNTPNGRVGLNYVERVPVQLLPAGVDVWVDEEGKIKTLQPVAEWLYEGRVHDLLVGRVLVTGPKKTGLTDEHIEKLKRFVRPLRSTH